MRELNEKRGKLEAGIRAVGEARNVRVEKDASLYIAAYRAPAFAPTPALTDFLTALREDISLTDKVSTHMEVTIEVARADYENCCTTSKLSLSKLVRTAR
jgi:hypothetical protein